MAERSETTVPPPSERPVLVTGGAGFIGSHVVDTFAAMGHPVVVLDDLSSGDETRLPPGVRFVHGDIRNVALSEILAFHKIDTIFHHAAQIDLRKSVTNPIFDAEVNVLGTIRLAQAAAAAKVKQIVFASTGGAIYGDPEGDRADEEHPLNPCSPYGVAKLAGEKYILALAPHGKYLPTILRYANVYGPRQDGTGEAGAVGIFMNRLLGGEDCVIYGDGEQTRDFVHVADVVAANRAAFSRRIPGVFNVGTGIETSVNRLYELVAEACGADRPARHEAAKPGEQRRSVLDPTRVQASLGLASFVPLREGLRATAEWFRMHRDKQGLK